MFVGIEFGQSVPYAWSSNNFQIIASNTGLTRDDARQAVDESNGFYDWLRNYQSKIVGVRYTIFEDYWAVSELARYCFPPISSDQVQFIAQSNTLEILLATDTRIDEAASDDQDFGTSFIVRRPNKGYCVAFELNNILLSDFGFELSELNPFPQQ